MKTSTALIIAGAGIGVISLGAYLVWGQPKPQECYPDGVTKCEGYDKYICMNGRWVLSEQNSPDCGYVPPECSPDGITKCIGIDEYTCINGEWVLTDPDSPNCPECSPDGVTQCQGNDLYECQNGRWVLIEANSPQCTTGTITVTNIGVRK